MSITETQENFISLEKELLYEDTISVTNEGKDVLALLRWDTYQAIAETLEILSDEEAYSELKMGLHQLQSGEVIDMEDVKKELHV